MTGTMRGPFAWLVIALAALRAAPTFLWHELIVGWEWDNPCARCEGEATGDGLCWDCRRCK